MLGAVDEERRKPLGGNSGDDKSLPMFFKSASLIRTSKIKGWVRCCRKDIFLMQHGLTSATEQTPPQLS